MNSQFLILFVPWQYVVGQVFGAVVQVIPDSFGDEDNTASYSDFGTKLQSWGMNFIYFTITYRYLCCIFIASFTIAVCVSSFYHNFDHLYLIV